MTSAARRVDAVQRDPRIGTIMGDRFRIVARLGAGGMGVVYRAVQLSVGREVALKIVRGAEAGEPSVDATGQRFLREARLASRLAHPAIVTTYDSGRTTDGELWIAMEELHGRSLREVLAHGRLPVERALAIAEQVAGALASAHAAGIVHRDVKPSNLMVLDDDRAKLLDFGLACTRRRGEDDSLTRSGVVCGTPAYLAPEIALGDAADERSDLYGLGLILHEMLTGEHPFPAATPEAQVARMLNEPPPRVAGVPDAVAEVVQRLLARAPAERCASAAIAREWIAALRAGRTPAAPRPRRRRTLRPLAARGAGFAVAAALAVVAWLCWPAHRPTTFRGTYVTTGHATCSNGVAWLRIDGERAIGGGRADAGQTIELVGTFKAATGSLTGAFTLADHVLGSFEGHLEDGHLRGTAVDYVYDCAGTFDLAPE